MAVKTNFEVFVDTLTVERVADFFSKLDHNKWCDYCPVFKEGGFCCSKIQCRGAFFLWAHNVSHKETE
jgi:hypothetical protein